MNMQYKFFKDLYDIQLKKREFLARRAAWQRSSLVLQSALIFFIFNGHLVLIWPSLSLFIVAIIFFIFSVFYMYKYHMVKGGRIINSASYFLDKKNTCLSTHAHDNEKGSKKFMQLVCNRLASCTDTNYEKNELRASYIEKSVNYLWMSFGVSLLLGGIYMFSTLYQFDWYVVSSVTENQNQVGSLNPNITAEVSEDSGGK